MNLVELDRALRQLRLSGMAAVLDTRLRQAQTEQMAPIDLVSALVAADAVLIPLHCEYFALEGLADLVGTMRRVRAALNPTLDIEGVIAQFADLNISEHALAGGGVETVIDLGNNQKITLNGVHATDLNTGNVHIVHSNLT